MDFEIRTFRSQDLNQVRAIEEASFPDPYSELIFRILRSRVGDLFIVAEKENVVGYAISEVRGRLGHVVSMAVSSEFRRSGVGHELLKETIRRLESRVDEIYLEVGLGNIAAIRLYEKFSFKKTGERRAHYYPGGEDAIIMARHSHLEAQ